MIMNKLTQDIFVLLRTFPRFWNPDEIKEAIESDYPSAEIKTLLNHHSDCKRFARVPACDMCNPLLNKSQTCRHPDSFYVFKIIQPGLALLKKCEKKGGG